MLMAERKRKTTEVLFTGNFKLTKLYNYTSRNLQFQTT
ncbi:predicted protein [Sclerotinia sclerotiorum 1980 UF-70]|uniref:Uncharacterized protein n=1 Tax=Sclerotinia sclerotiorum (strain ATCC 18683 / 1980 / Ss-1) TaxID=665079 RepID=A7F759_SCLS1|nr:predicted protein [Sclerotinia sclerotiorum 1980 UF-70]EDN98580.1 predicted protein [Sclerotinia sclerotiorum 1980 UF-70]